MKYEEEEEKETTQPSARWQQRPVRVTGIYASHNSPLANTIQVLHALSVWLLARAVAQVLVIVYPMATPTRSIKLACATAAAVWGCHPQV